MTNERAIEIVNATIFLLDNEDYSDEVEEALHMAIKALEHEQALKEAFNIALLYGKEKGMEAIDKALYQIGLEGLKEKAEVEPQERSENDSNKRNDNEQR